MSTYMDLDKCQILCSCKRTFPLARLYFCRHCSDIRCCECVSHEVDSHYCPNCLENMASAEAKMRKHRCSNCFDCPSCGHTLSTRATAIVLPKPDEPSKTMAQKAYYLTCSFCRWSTRDSGIPDQRQSAGGWLETENPHAKRISELIDSYHHLAVKEKADREWSKFVRNRNYMMLLERYPVLNPRLRRYCSTTWSTPNRDSEPAKKVNIPAAEAPEKPMQFDVESYVAQPLVLAKVTTVQQRRLAPQIQPKFSALLEPHPKCLVVKRSMRCRSCEHNLSKADFNPSSIKFRINLSATYHVPEVRFILPPPLKPSSEAADESRKGSTERRRTSMSLQTPPYAERLIHYDCVPGKARAIVLTLNNPAHRVTTVSLRQLTTEEEIAMSINTDGMDPSTGLLEMPTESSTLVGSSGDVSSESTSKAGFSTVKLTLPTEPIKLAPRNDIADYDDSLSANVQTDGPDDVKIIAFRRGNKVGIHVGMTPLADLVATRSVSRLSTMVEEQVEEHTDDDVVDEATTKVTPTVETRKLFPLRAAISLRFDYKNTTTTSLLSEQRAVAAAASAAAASASATASSNTKKSGSDAAQEQKPVTPASQPGQGGGADLIKDLEVIFLLGFGEQALD